MRIDWSCGEEKMCERGCGEEEMCENGCGKEEMCERGCGRVPLEGDVSEMTRSMEGIRRAITQQ